MSRRYDFTRFPRVSVGSFELAVLTRATAKAAYANAKATGLSLAEEKVRASVVAVDDVPVAQPYMALDGWTSRTRQFVFNAWGELNGIKEVEARQVVASGKLMPSGATRFDVAGLAGVSISSFALRDVTGKEEARALATARANGTDPSEELALISLAEVNDQPFNVAEAAVIVDAWTHRTLLCIGRAYDAINSALPEELDEDFRRGEEPRAAAASPTKWQPLVQPNGT